MINRSPRKSDEFDEKRAFVNTRCRFPGNDAAVVETGSIAIGHLREQE